MLPLRRPAAGCARTLPGGVISAPEPTRARRSAGAGHDPAAPASIQQPPAAAPASAPPASLIDYNGRSSAHMAPALPGQYPCLVEAAGPMTACGADYQEFHDRFGIDLFIAGVEAKAAEARAAGSPTS